MQNSQKDALSRRAFVGKIAAGAAGAAVAIAAGSARSEASVRRFDSGDPTSGEVVHNPAELANAPSAESTAASSEIQTATTAELTAPAPWNVLRPLTVGSAVAANWRVVDLSAPAYGSCVLTLGNDSDRTHRIHICRNDGQPRGLVYTERFDLVVMNGGRGDLPTEEGFGQAVAAVAHVIASNEGTGRAQSLAGTLLAQADRETRFADSPGLR